MILTKKSDLDLKAILEPLNLEITMPMLNWTLVSKKGRFRHKEITLDSPEAEDDRLILKSLLKNPFIISAEHNFALSHAAVSKHMPLHNQWQFLEYSSKNPIAMDLAKAWEISIGSPDITIAVIDNFLFKGAFSFEERFPKCKDRVQFLSPHKNYLASAEQNPLPHGELMLLALGACNDHKNLPVGIDKRAKLLAIENPNPGYAQYFLSALYAAGVDICQESIVPCEKEIGMPPKPADIILMPISANAPELLRFSADMLLRLAKNNVTVVSAAGNDNQPAANYFPGAMPSIINVGALNRRGTRAAFSNYGLGLSLMAPGNHISFPYPNGPKVAQGTSLSAAYVAGTIALIKDVNPKLSPKAYHFFLTKSGRRLSCDNYCHGENSCKEQCCQNPLSCGQVSLDIASALSVAKRGEFDSPVIEIDRNFVLFFRGEDAAHTLLVKNIGDKTGEISALSYDQNVVISPNKFSLSSGSKQELLISFLKEPFKRQIFKVDILAHHNDKLSDQGEFYIEYVPKR